MHRQYGVEVRTSTDEVQVVYCVLVQGDRSPKSIEAATVIVLFTSGSARRVESMTPKDTPANEELTTMM